MGLLERNLRLVVKLCLLHHEPELGLLMYARSAESVVPCCRRSEEKLLIAVARYVCQGEQQPSMVLVLFSFLDSGKNSILLCRTERRMVRFVLETFPLFVT